MDSGQSYSRVNRLTKRSQYLAVRRGVKRYGKYFLLEVFERRNLLDNSDKTVKSDKKTEPDKRVEMKTTELKKGVGREDDLRPRIGFTVTKRQGNAVKRNRIRRRLKEAVRLETHKFMKPGHDYVLVGYKEILSAPFGDIIDSLEMRFKNLKKSDRTSVVHQRRRKSKPKQT